MKLHPFALEILENQKAKYNSSGNVFRLGSESKQQKNLNKLIEITTPPQRPITIGVGDRAVVCGGEEVLFRHQLTYYNETAIFIEIADDDPDLEDISKYLTDLKIERIGDVLQINGIALRCVSGDANQYKLAAKKLSESSTESMNA